MSVPRELILKRSGEWLRRAYDDLHASRRLLDASGSLEWIVAFHAQQCAEKSLKAVLLAREVDFPYTHDIRLLLELCGGWAQFREAERLTVYAVSARYPGVQSGVSRVEAERALSLAHAVFEHVKQLLAAEGISVPGE